MSCRQKDKKRDGLSHLFHFTYLVFYVRQQCHLTGALDRDCQLTLILRLCSCYTARSDLTVRADEFSQELNILVINVLDVVFCEVADLSAAGSLLSECHLISPLSLEREIVAGNIQG